MFGVLTFTEGPNVDKNLATPFIGLWERINIAAFMVWVIVFSVILLKAEKKNSLRIQNKNNELNEIVLKFRNGQNMLDNMLNSKKCVFDKGGLGYKPNLKQKYFKNYFV